MPQKLKKENYLVLVGLMNLILAVVYSINATPILLDENSMSVGFFGLWIFVISCLQYLFLVLFLALIFRIGSAISTSKRDPIRPFKIAFNWWIGLYTFHYVRVGSYSFRLK